MTVVGVTGKYCAGKDTAARILVSHGYREIDVDKLGHEALHSEHARIVGRFGPEVSGPDGEVDRRALGDIVFASASALRDLESIVHPVMLQAARSGIAELRNAGASPGVVINAAILFRMGLHRLCDTVIYVEAPLILRLRRAQQRDGLSLRDVVRRLRAQRDVAPQFLTSDADVHSVQNDGSQEQLGAKLSQLLPLP